MTHSSIDEIEVSKQVELFSPIFHKHLANLTIRFAKEIDRHLAMGTWHYIINEKTSAAFKDHHMETAWRDFEGFFQHESPFLLFIEMPLKGLINKKAKFWLFKEAKIAVDFFRFQSEKPNNFHPNVIRSLPYMHLGKPLAVRLQSLLEEEGRWIQKITKIENLLKIADFYLPPKDLSKFTQILKLLLKNSTLQEVRALKKDLNNPNVSPTMLEKRSAALYRIGFRFYIFHRGAEKDYLKKLLFPEAKDRQQGLKLLEVRLTELDQKKSEE